MERISSKDQNFDIQNYYKGLEFETWKYYGAHPLTDGKGYIFRTYAPSAKAVGVIGSFSEWEELPMTRLADKVSWEVTVPNAAAGDMYKLRITVAGGKEVDHADPYAFFSELRPGTASILYDLGQYRFHDAQWLAKRSDCKKGPLNIYEMHMGSWRRSRPVTDGEDPKNGWLTYRETADLLIPYLKQYGYNAVEVMPLCEYPADESWGYQATGFFSITGRYGEPDDLRYLIDACHQNDIAVICDVVTVHFAVNDYGLWRYDGTALYEYPSDDIGRSEWGSCNFMHAHGDVRSFLQSSCNFLLEEFHFDGLRFDAVSNLIYWQGEYARGINKEATGFLQTMNRGLKERHPSVMLIAEDSTMYEKTTWQADYGGLNFDYKWDLGWMNDTLAYLHMPFADRPREYGKLTQSMSYFAQAFYLLPLSHDEVVHMKGTIVEKIYGNFEQRITQIKTLYLYMMTHPGKKLSFMGNELALTREWNEQRQPDWNSIRDPLHASVGEFVEGLNHLYLEHPALWEKDYTEGGFSWIERGRPNDGLIAFERTGIGDDGIQETLVCLFNFSDHTVRYRLPEKYVGKLQVLYETAHSTVSMTGGDAAIAPLSGACLIQKDS